MHPDVKYLLDRIEHTEPYNVDTRYHTYSWREGVDEVKVTVKYRHDRWYVYRGDEYASDTSLNVAYAATLNAEIRNLSAQIAALAERRSQVSRLTVMGFVGRCGVPTQVNVHDHGWGYATDWYILPGGRRGHTRYTHANMEWTVHLTCGICGSGTTFEEALGRADVTLLCTKGQQI